MSRFFKRTTNSKAPALDGAGALATSPAGGAALLSPVATIGPSAVAPPGPGTVAPPPQGTEIPVQQHDESGVWPRTNRVMPWLVALFLAMIWLVPFDSIRAPFSFGVDSKLDRILLVMMLTLWCILAAAGGRHAPRFRRSGLNLALLFFISVAVASVLAGAPVLSNVGDFTLAVKQLALLFAYVGFFFLVVTVVRPDEVKNFLKFMVVLACLTAIGTICEYRFHTNYFYSLAQYIFHGFTVSPPPLGNRFGRPAVIGPTQTSLADAAILSMALSFAIVFLFHARDWRKRAFWYIAAAILFAGTVSTQRKSSVLIPMGTIVALGIYSPKRMLRFAPAMIGLVLAVAVVSPHAISGLAYQFQVVSTSSSTAHRTSAYPIVTPYIFAHPLIGRGWGAFDPHKYVILDSQYINILIDTGFVGLAAYLILLLTGIVLAHKAARSPDPERSQQGVGLVGAIVGFAIASATFDILAFAQVPYLLMFVLAMAVVAADPSARRTAAIVAGATAAPRARTAQPPRRPARPSRRPAPTSPRRRPRGETHRRPRRLGAPQWAMLTLTCTLAASSLGFASARGSSARRLPAPRTQHAAPVVRGPSASYGRELDLVIARLNAVRSTAGSHLRWARDAQAQAAAARQLATAHARAAKSIAGLKAGPEADASSAVRIALTRVGDVYAALARAAIHNDMRAYNAARASLTRADRSLVLAFTQLAKLGYRIT